MAVRHPGDRHRGLHERPARSGGRRGPARRRPRGAETLPSTRGRGLWPLPAAARLRGRVRLGSVLRGRQPRRAGLRADRRGSDPGAVRRHDPPGRADRRQPDRRGGPVVGGDLHEHRVLPRPRHPRPPEDQPRGVHGTLAGRGACPARPGADPLRVCRRVEARLERRRPIAPGDHPGPGGGAGCTTRTPTRRGKFMERS